MLCFVYSIVWSSEFDCFFNNGFPVDGFNIVIVLCTYNIWTVEMSHKNNTYCAIILFICSSFGGAYAYIAIEVLLWQITEVYCLSEPKKCHILFIQYYNQCANCMQILNFKFKSNKWFKKYINNNTYAVWMHIWH